MPRSSPPSARCPLEPFRYYRYGDRTVHLDGCVEVEAAYYGAPPGWIGRRVARAVGRPARAAARSEDRPAAARASARAARLASHRGRRSPDAHAADDAGAARGRAARRARDRRALRADPPATRAKPGVRRILGVLALAKKHGAGRRRGRRQAALELGVPTYRFVRRYLERRPPVPLTLRQVDPLIRQLTLYRDLIDRTTGDPT